MTQRATLTLDELLARSRTALERVAEVRVAYVFGSQATGRARPDSDLDLAVDFGRDLNDLERGRLKLQVIDGLTAELGGLGERSDVVDLRRAGSAVAFAAIRDGMCVLARTAAERVQLEAGIARRYDDERPYRDLFRAAARAAGSRMGNRRGGS